MTKTDALFGAKNLYAYFQSRSVGIFYNIDYV